MFALDFNIITYALGGGALLAVMLLLALILPPLRRVRRAVRVDAMEGMADVMVEFPAVSIIVHAQSDPTPLAQLIEQLMAQQYPSPFEVIVINDGGDEAVSDVGARYEKQYRNLYMTFAPARSRNLSRRKLAITLGVKAARYEVVALLRGNTRLRSDRWLLLMMRHIALGKDIVAGYGYDVPSGQADRGRHRLMAFDVVRTSVQYLYSALRGRLYRAYAGNLAYRTRLFFDSKGFSGNLNLRFGDDDIFVSGIATRDNFAVELSPDAMVEVVEDYPQMMHRLDKLRHDFTARFVSRRQRLRWGFISLLWWVWTGLGVATIVTGLPSLIPLCSVTVLSLLLCLPVMLTWRSTSAALRSRKLCLTVPFMLWIAPFYTLVYRIIGRRRRTSNYTWHNA